MGSIYKIFEKCPDVTLVFAESADNLEQAKTRFLALMASSQREYLIWDPGRRYELVLRAAATN
jgi:hypothetical protein